MASMANQMVHTSRLSGSALANLAQSNTSKTMTNACMTPLLSSASSTFYTSTRLQSCALSKPRRASVTVRSALEAPKAAKEPAKKAKGSLKKAPEAEKEVVSSVKENVEKAPEGAEAAVGAVTESVKKAPEAVQEAVEVVNENVRKAPEVVKETVEAVKENVKEAVEGTTEEATEVAKPQLKRQLTRTRSFHHPRGGLLKADPLRVIMFQVTQQPVPS